MAGSAAAATAAAVAVVVSAAATAIADSPPQTSRCRFCLRYLRFKLGNKDWRTRA